MLALSGAAFVAIGLAAQPAKADAIRTIGKVLSGAAAGGAFILSEAARALQPGKPQTKAKPKDIAKAESEDETHREAKISHIGGAHVAASHDEPDPFANVPSATPVKADD